MITPPAERITIRAAVPDDGPALLRIHADVARYYQERASDYFEPPAPEGLAGELAAQAAQPGESRARHLVAEAQGAVVGALVARLVAPDEQRDRETEADSAQLRLRIEYLATAAAYRRRGIGTRLVKAAEEWGRTSGATVAATTAFQGSPLSVPFWEDRMGYEELSINLRKRL